MQDRRLKKRKESLKQARQLLDAAGLLPPGARHNEALKKARQAEVAAQARTALILQACNHLKDHPSHNQRVVVLKRTGPKVREGQKPQ